MNGGENGSEGKKTLRFHPKIVYKLDINNHKTISNKKDMPTPVLSLMNLNKNFSCIIYFISLRPKPIMTN